jgi:tRNA pseudouridine65 synthase
MTDFVPPEIGELTLLHEDDDIIVVDKPWGALVHNSSFAGPRERSLKQALEAQTGLALQPLHRLDRGTSGLVIFLKNKQAFAEWSAALGADTTQKQYLSIARGRLKSDGISVVRPLKDDKGVVYHAQSTIWTLATSEIERCSLVYVTIFTGRTHQIRRHLVHLRHPVVGDSVHGDTKFNRAFRESTGLARLALHAHSLTMTTPRGQRLSIVCPPSGPLGEAISALF